MPRNTKSITTSIKASEFVRNEINMRKAYLEWKYGKNMTLNDALLEMCRIFDLTYGKPPKSGLVN